ncbi:MAG: hypothetical protein OEY94_01830 [Alphaproteobacteria bacterium]|nr:hypothetical protein [Alphaproteobacteria bacterium]
MLGFLAPLVTGTGAALGRSALIRAAPKAMNSAWNWTKSLLSKKPTFAGLIMASGLPTIAATIDNATGNRISGALLKTPIGPALEKFLKFKEFSNDQEATVVANSATNYLVENGRLKENAPDYDRSKSIIKALGHLAIGDEFGAATKAAELGIETSDLVAALNQAREENPNGAPKDLGVAAFQKLREKLREKDSKLEAAKEFSTAAAAAPAVAPATASVATPDAVVEPQVTRSETPKSVKQRKRLSLDDVSNEGISTIFEKAADNAGFMGMIMRGISFISGLFGQKANFQRWALDNVMTKAKYKALQAANGRGNVVSRMGGLEQGFNIPEPAY